MGIADEFFTQNKSSNSPNGDINLHYPYILNHGGIDDRKNNLNIIKALPFVKKYLLVITGYNKTLSLELASLAKDLGISERVIFTGWINQNLLIKLVRNAKTIIYPSKAEGFGMPLLEGMALGIPIVASDLEVFHEYGDNVPIYVNPDDCRDIANGINKAIKGISKERIEKGKSIAKKYTWDRALKETIATYYEAVKI
jgi:glycosyltransferase involved in cell wall biosynthesis